MRLKQQQIAILGILATLGIAKFAVVLHATGHGRWLGEAVAYGLMVTLLLLLARVAPQAISLDLTWVPSARSDWMWFVGLVLVLIGGGMIMTFVVGPLNLRVRQDLVQRPETVVVQGIVLVLFIPAMEEVFWRGYVLDQLTRLMHSGVALLLQASMFAVSHFTLMQQGVLYLTPVFWYGIILGIWRLRFRSMLPLVFAHIILNAVAVLPRLTRQYDFAAEVWSTPDLRNIAQLSGASAQSAVPTIISFLGNPNEDVRNYATRVLITRYRHDLPPYLRDALKSRDNKIVLGALFVVDLTQMCALTHEVRNVVWSNDNNQCQRAAIVTLYCLGDTEGIRDVAHRHPDKAIREVAHHALSNGRKNSADTIPNSSGPIQ